MTTKRFTGQYHESSIPGGEGLYFYNARWYDAKLGRFVSPDTLVPDAGNPQSFNRYSYVYNNPLKYNDPSGHCPICIVAVLAGVALFLQGDDPNHQSTQEEINSQKLGAAHMFGGVGALAVSGVVGTVSVATTAETIAAAACRDGDCGNEVRGTGQVVQNAAKATESGLRLRQQYENAVHGLSGKADQMRSAGKSAEEIARSLHAERRSLGEQFKAITPPDALEQIYARNIERYGNKLGPTIEWLVERGIKQGKSMEHIWEGIIESASRPGGTDIIPKLLGK